MSISPQQAWAYHLGLITCPFDVAKDGHFRTGPDLTFVFVRATEYTSIVIALTCRPIAAVSTVGVFDGRFDGRSDGQCDPSFGHRNSVRPSVCPSVSHTGELVKNGASWDHQIFTVSCLHGRF